MILADRVVVLSARPGRVMLATRSITCARPRTAAMEDSIEFHRPHPGRRAGAQARPRGGRRPVDVVPGRERRRRVGDDRRPPTTTGTRSIGAGPPHAARARPARCGRRRRRPAVAVLGGRRWGRSLAAFAVLARAWEAFVPPGPHPAPSCCPRPAPWPQELCGPPRRWWHDALVTGREALLGFVVAFLVALVLAVADRPRPAARAGPAPGDHDGAGHADHRPRPAARRLARVSAWRRRS